MLARPQHCQIAAPFGQQREKQTLNTTLRLLGWGRGHKSHTEPTTPNHHIQFHSMASFRHERVILNTTLPSSTNRTSHRDKTPTNTDFQRSRMKWGKKCKYKDVLAVDMTSKFAVQSCFAPRTHLRVVCWLWKHHDNSNTNHTVAYRTDLYLSERRETKTEHNILSLKYRTHKSHRSNALNTFCVTRALWRTWTNADTFLRCEIACEERQTSQFAVRSRDSRCGQWFAARSCFVPRMVPIESINSVTYFTRCVGSYNMLQ